MVRIFQVADDMHVMTEAITDMRNLTFGMVAITVVGMVVFIVLKVMQTQKHTMRRRRRLQNVSDTTIIIKQLRCKLLIACFHFTQ